LKNGKISKKKLKIIIRALGSGFGPMMMNFRISKKVSKISLNIKQ